ncbi:heparan sulfate 2-O-sulfotransferase 1-like [Antedon mediterranea]|uniref:heparan sulfate 2-O-sulfotransferase 1-like n=1 Tax=Antedon mediterranea TaxID=105859 RepID=UPI003AF4224A
MTMGLRSLPQTKATLFIIMVFLFIAIISVEVQIRDLQDNVRKLENKVIKMERNGDFNMVKRRTLKRTNKESFVEAHRPSSVKESNQKFFDTRDLVIIYNRVPKTGSTSFTNIAYDLCVENEFNVLHINTTRNMHVMALADQMRFVVNITNWTARKPAFYHGHLGFIDFTRFGSIQQPIYINLIRQPLERLVSYFYFLRYGDDYRPNMRRTKQGDKMTFDECVSKEMPECLPEKLWMQIPFFCGHFQECWNPGSEWALQQAKYNLVTNYLVVGLTEEMEDFIAVLEATVPSMFTGALELYQHGKRSHLRKTSTKIDPSAATIAKIKNSIVWKMEDEFYNFARTIFHDVKRRTLHVKNGEYINVPQRFTFEKIRPKLPQKK